MTGALHFGKRFIEAAEEREMFGVPVMSGGVVGIESDRAAIFFFGSLPVPIVILCDQSERDMSFGEIFIQSRELSGLRRAL